jgi:hypothetical protein
MSRINPDLFRRLTKRLGIEKSRVYGRINAVASSTGLPRHLAAVRLAMDLQNISVERYTNSEEKQIIRATFSGTVPPPVTTSVTSNSSVTGTPHKLKRKLDFVSSKLLRQVLERDIDELNTAIESGIENTKKTCLILAGSIAESLLLDSLMKREADAKAAISKLSKKPSNDPEEWDLGEMLEIAQNMTPQLLPKDSDPMATQVKGWRNLIHPGRELRDTRKKNVKPTKPRALAAVAFLEHLVEELS